MRYTGYILFFIILLAVAGLFYGWKKDSNTPSLANPASVNCTQALNGVLEIVDEANGQVGYCHLPDGRTCEEWALLQGGTCTPKGGTAEKPSDANQIIKLYYYNPKLDQGPGGAQCSEKGIVAVERSVSKTATPIEDAIKLLLRGELSDEEKGKGIVSEFPLPGVSLSGASLADGELTLTFNDPNNKLSGGSCRVSILSKEVTATAKQFPEVKSVRLKPDELFQP